jgi:hypothetical protein
MCASWFSINRGPAPLDSTVNLNKVGVAADTIIKKKEKAKTEKDKTKTEKDKTKPEKIKSDATADEDLVLFPPMPDIEIPEHPDFTPPDIDIMIPLDVTVPLETDIHIHGGDYEAEFMERFKERFGDFYEKNQAELERMIAEIEKEKFSHVDLAAMEANAKVHQVMAERHKEISRVQEVKMQEHEEKMKEFDAQMKAWEKENEKRMEKFELQMKEFEKEFEAFNAKLRDELIRDGYLGKDEKLDHIRITDDEVIEVNGKQIKQSDLKKYQDFFKNNSPKSPPHPK